MSLGGILDQDGVPALGKRPNFADPRGPAV